MWLYKLLLIIALVALPGCFLLPQHYPINKNTDLLTSDRYHKIIIEVISVDSHTACHEDLEYLRKIILSYCHKAEVVIAIDNPLPMFTIFQAPLVVPYPLWVLSSLKAFEVMHANFTTHNDTVVIRILYLPGSYLPSPECRGLAYDDYAFVIFRNLVEPHQERAVLVHELGHLLGLVNCGIKPVSDHQDDRHKWHCKNPKCVMYYSSPSTKDADYDAECKKDLKSMGSK